MKKAISWFIGKTKSFFPRDLSFFELFRQMGEQQEQIAFLFSEQITKHGFGDAEYSRKAEIIEHDGDVITKKVSHYLRDVFITPLDRDDIHHLAHELDNVIDFIEDAMIRIEMYDIKEYSIAITGFAQLIKEASINLSQVIDCMAENDGTRLQPLKVEIRELERKADSLRRTEITRLHKELQDAKLIAQHERVIERLERVMDQYKEVVEMIDRVVVKAT
ncbi:hypothetical protein A3A05_01735 [Candidatus Nomurabacteria bacterium RIFCSPLOWO2_01_FULL_41_12]|uniref:Phosphate transport regulator n=1 Tax=Candidatus Nomurabacteria bacterium RIFCSPLOWO2_01_FULL_41_12 TaxID=1801774 RepID=A0A1F6WWV2_9BACT|nr:MAG: hypothetical protein A2732_01890 [Candidatus Nomurabacteria bacterium RIFCSPHIGHO2_01_FULL_40_10]OGI86377.1 MAG: hypothetical protein A3A05_01735 [Candidatus Nomurabacteria bacterium RIFCSPLOWO2_01_FULL_41_12]